MTAPRSAVLGVALAGSALWGGGAASAQGDRFEIGLRLRAFERALAVVEDPQRRDQAFVALEEAVQAFFGLDMKRVAASIEAASIALSGRRPGRAERFARSLQVIPRRRLIDAAGTEALTISVRQLYEVDGLEGDPPDLTIAWRLHDAGDWTQRPVGDLPAALEVSRAPVPAGDHEFCWRLCAGEDVLVERRMAFAAADDLRARLDRVLAAARAAKKLAPRSIESLTLGSLANLLRTTQRSNAYETELRGFALLREAERLAAALAEPGGGRVYDRRRPGAFRLRVPVGDSTVSCRLFAPEVDEGVRPVVVALHGAGGSENLFFDGYGDGLCVDLAARRGWFVVSPRNGMGALDCAALVAKLGERYPVDRDRVFVVGHSMGAMQAVRNVSASPSSFRAVAPIAGGGRVRASEALAEVPFFVAAGARDFGRQGARQLHRALQRAGAKAAWRLYPSVEHLAIVQVALPDVFAFFDEHVR